MHSAKTCRAEPPRGLSLQEIRKTLALPQTALARQLNVSQPYIAQFESQDDMLITTLRRHIEALGGELELLAHFPKQSIEIALPHSRQKAINYPANQQNPGRASC
jgi:transcriptional regulator with XRE-family HTH domain